jgi:hypothetical protein
MKKTALLLGVILALLQVPGASQAQIPGVSLFTGAIKKVIVALDLKVQRMQNEVIALQNAQKQLENNLSSGKLNEITGWLGQEKELYQSYYQELTRVKAVVSDFELVRKTISQQVQLVGEYKRAWALFSNDRHFKAAELRYMAGIYNGILQESVRNLDELMLVITNAQMRMNDGERLRMISKVAGAIQENLNSLRQFNGQNAALSYHRSRSDAERLQTGKLYGVH